MKIYKRLSEYEREEISRMLSQKCSFRDIARELGRNVSAPPVLFINRVRNAGTCGRILEAKYKR